jgi:hypothetical protein
MRNKLINILLDFHQNQFKFLNQKMVNFFSFRYLFNKIIFILGII